MFKVFYFRVNWIYNWEIISSFCDCSGFQAIIRNKDNLLSISAYYIRIYWANYQWIQAGLSHTYVLLLLSWSYSVLFIRSYGQKYLVTRFLFNRSSCFGIVSPIFLHPLRIVSLMNKFTNCSLETCFQQVLLFCNCKFVVNISFEGA